MHPNKPKPINPIDKAHSEDYFGPYRDFWWNLDYLQLISKRLQLNQVKSVLDVGCGVGHWGQLLSNLLNEESQFVGIDLETSSIQKAQFRALEKKLESRFQYQHGNAEQIPFGDNTFDMVTCQTLLIHVKDPKHCLREMLRVLKTNGILLLAEPNNFANASVVSNLTQSQSIDEIMDQLRFELTLQRGKKALGLGFNSEGDFIPGYLNELGAKSIQVFISDKATPFIPPYSTLEQQIHIQQWKEWTDQQFLGWEKDEMKKYFTAGGGNDLEFERLWLARYHQFLDSRDSIANNTYHTAGGGLHYLITARKSE